MSITKNYGLAGVGSTVQYGKKGGSLRYTPSTSDGAGGQAPAFQVRNNANSGLLRIQGSTPLANDDLTTKLYVDNLVQGLDIKASVRLATDGTNVSLSGATPLVIDTITAANNDRVLLKNQIDAKQNGIYVVSISGSNYTLTRAVDADNNDNSGVASSEVSGGMFTFVEEGTMLADTGWVLSSPNGKVTLGTDVLVFSQFSSAGVVQPGVALSKTGNVVDVKFDNTTVFANASNQLAVKSSSTANQILISAGSGSATWGSLDISKSATVGTSVLGATNGGTGQNTYAAGDILVGDVNNTLSKITKGAASSVFGVDSSGVQGYRYLSRLHDSNGNIMLGSTSVASATNYFNITNSTGSGDLTLSTAGTGNDLNMVLSPKGNGVILARSGYDTWLNANRATVPNDALITKGLMEARVASIDTTRIQSSAGDTFVATAQSGFSNRVAVGSNSKVVAEFIGATTAGVATSGERLTVSHVSNEVQLGAVNSAGTGNVNLRFLPQQQGQVFIGSTGAGLVQGEDGYQLTLKGGNNTAGVDAGNLVLRGGDATSGNFNAGNVRIFPGTNSGTGSRGSVRIEDDRQTIVANFIPPASPAANWFEFQSSVNDPDAAISAVKIKAALASANADVSIQLDPKGNGLVRVADPTTYLAALASAGQQDALVTKSYVQGVVSGNTRVPTVGLSQDDTTLNVNIGATTIKTDGSNNLILSSSAVANQVMLSSGTLGTEAAFGALPLNNTNSVTGLLGINNGGTGISSYTANDLLVGNTSGGLTKLAKGSNNQVLTVNSSGNLAWGFQGALRDGNGLVAAQAVGVTNAVNYTTFANSATTGAVVIGTDGADANITMVLSPKGTGVVAGKTGYTAQIGSNRETFITKGYVDDSLQSNTDPLVRRVAINSGWNSVMPVSVPTPNVPGRTVYLHRATLNVITAVSGGNTVNARIVAGTNEVMNQDENDIGVANTYVSDLPWGFSSTNTQINIEFYQADGVTLATPTAGNITVSVEYKII